MRIDIHIPWLARKITALKISTPTVTQLASPSGGAGSGTKVTLSDAARHTASAADAPVGHAAKTNAISELRDLIKQYDFHSITPRQMATLGGELFKRGEISEEAACSFNGIELDTVVKRDPNKPIDIVAHFKWMLDTVESAARSDSTLSYGVASRREASQVLANVMSFVDSDRQHISG